MDNERLGMEELPDYSDFKDYGEEESNKILTPTRILKALKSSTTVDLKEMVFSDRRSERWAQVMPK